ncbi:MAG: hypothetical protein WB988_02625 [Candidatus Nitrosopolaris sp.]
MQITWVVVLVGLSIILFEVFPEKSVWSIPVTQVDEHMIAVPAGGLTLLLGQKQEAYKTLTKDPISLGCFIRKPVSIDYLLKRIRSELD